MKLSTGVLCKDNYNFTPAVISKDGFTTRPRALCISVVGPTIMDQLTGAWGEKGGSSSLEGTS